MYSTMTNDIKSQILASVISFDKTKTLNHDFYLLANHINTKICLFKCLCNGPNFYSIKKIQLLHCFPNKFFLWY